jgi:hypothetical protein
VKEREQSARLPSRTQARPKTKEANLMSLPLTFMFAAANMARPAVSIKIDIRLYANCTLNSWAEHAEWLELLALEQCSSSTARKRAPLPASAHGTALS